MYVLRSDGRLLNETELRNTRPDILFPVLLSADDLELLGADPLPPQPRSIESLQNEKWLAIQGELDRRKDGGVKIGDDWFPNDDSSRIRYLALLSAVSSGQGMPAIPPWLTLGGGYVTMTPELLVAIFGQIVANEGALFTACNNHRSAMLASDDPASYDFAGGWPLTYQDEVTASDKQ